MRFIFLIIAIFLSHSVSASPQKIADPTLRALTKLALENNPEIQSAYHQWSALRDVIPQSRSLPDPKVLFNYENMPGNNITGAFPINQITYGISQEIPFPMKLVNNGDIATINANRAACEYCATTLSILGKLKKLYYELYAVNKSISILEKNKSLLMQIEKTVRSHYVVGKVPQQDIFRAQVEISRINMRIVMLNQEATSLQADINKVLNRSMACPVPTNKGLPLTEFHETLPTLYHAIDQFSPQLKAQLNEVRKNEKLITAGKLNYLPDFEIGAAKIQDSAMRTQGYEVMATATIPLYFSTKQNYEVSQARANYAAGIQDLATTSRELSFRVKDAFLREKRAAELIHLLRDTIIPQASLAWLSSQSSYAVGKVDFLTTLNNLLSLQENEIELYQQISAQESAIANIEEIIGIQ